MEGGEPAARAKDEPLGLTRLPLALGSRRGLAAILAAFQNEDRGLTRPIYEIGGAASSIWRCPGP
jgi:hypothetical protein